MSNVKQFVPRVDCVTFSKCGKYSLSFCRRNRYTYDACRDCTLLRNNSKSNVRTVDGVKIKRCSICGEEYKLNRFYIRQRRYKNVIYKVYTSECRMCYIKAVQERKIRNESKK